MQLRFFLLSIFASIACAAHALEVTDGTDVGVLNDTPTASRANGIRPAPDVAGRTPAKPQPPVDDAMYYPTLRNRIEKAGMLYYPKLNGKRLQGELEISIPVYQDGTLYEKGGGPRVVRSSGNPALDAAALRIVRRAAPFPSFSRTMRENSIDGVMEFTVPFNFMIDEIRNVRKHRIELK